MNTKKVPAVVSLLAGLIALVVTYLERAELIEILTTLFIVLLSFYILGCIVKAIIDKLTVVEEEPEEELENIEVTEAEET